MPTAREEELPVTSYPSDNDRQQLSARIPLRRACNFEFAPVRGRHGINLPLKPIHIPPPHAFPLSFYRGKCVNVSLLDGSTIQRNRERQCRRRNCVESSLTSTKLSPRHAKLSDEFRRAHVTLGQLAWDSFGTAVIKYR